MNRDNEIRLVREFAGRPEVDGIPASRRTPILVFTGARGCGKSTVLADISDRLEGHIPHGRHDIEAHAELSVRQHVAALAFELNRRSGGYGRLRFPRFITGQLAISQDLDADALTAREQLRIALEEHRDIERLRDFLRYLLADIASFQGMPTNSVGQIADVVLAGLTSMRWGRRVLLGWGHQWYGDRDRGLSRDPLDELVYLNRRARQHPHDEDVHEVLWSALLADLRAEFRTTRSALARPLNCVLLLDNVDGAAGRAVLGGLMLARERLRRADPEAVDPLTVVATSRTARPAWASTSDEWVPTHEEAGYDHYATCSRTDPDWYPVRLPHFTEPQIRDHMAAEHIGASREHAATVHRFTEGHPASTGIILGALGTADPDLVELRELLDSERDDPAPAAERILAGFLTHLSDDAVEDLVTCSAARDLNQALELETPDGVLRTVLGGERDSVFDPAQWRCDDDPTAAATLPRVLQRLLLRRLAVRDSQHPASWEHVHGWFRDNSEGLRTYHAMALGEVASTTRDLAARLPSTDPEEWLAELDALVEAPNRLDHSRTPLHHVQTLSSWALDEPAPLAALARLISSLWLDNDPLIDAARRPCLRSGIVVAYREIAPYSRDGYGELMERARQYDER